MIRTLVFCSGISALAPSLTLAEARKTVAVAPLSTSSSAEYQWIGSAIARGLSLRIHAQSQLNAVTQRQIAAAMRQDNVDVTRLGDDEVAMRLGRQVGADVMLVGSFTAAWPDITIILKTIDPVAGKVLNTHEFSDDLDALVEIEARAATALARELGVSLDNAGTDLVAKPGTLGTMSIRAWRDATVAFDIISWQSLTPRSADPNVPLLLPEQALEQAQGLLSDATKRDPNYGEAWASLGIVQALLKDHDAAWRSFGKATALGLGHNPTAVLGASFVRMREGRYDDAAKILESAIEHRPGFLHARGYLGQLYNHLGRYAEAEKVFDAYHQLAPKNPWVLAQLGYTRARLENFIGAIEASIAAVDLLPDSPSLLVELASRYIDAGKLAGAEDALRHAMELFPDEGRIYVRLSYVYLLQDNIDLAIPISEKGLALANLSNRDRGYAHVNLARALGRQGKLDEAFEHLEQSKKHGITSFAEVAKDPHLRKLRADARYAKGGFGS